MRAFWTNRTIPAVVQRPQNRMLGPHQGRILTLVSHELTATGAPKLALEVAKACLAEGWAVVVVSPEDGLYRDLFVQAGAIVIVSPLTWGRASPVFDLARYSDVVLCNTIVAALLVRHGLPAPLVWYVHETEYIATFDRPDIGLAAAFRSARQIWAASPMVARSLAAFTDRAEVMGATVQPVAPRSHPMGDTARLLVMGGIEPRKGQLGLAHAAATLTEQQRAGISLTIHGRETDPAYAAQVRQAAASLPFWHDGGPLPPTVALDVLAAADGVIIPSLDEPLSLVALEAMSAGKVVICTQCCGIADFLEDGINAFISPDASPDGLAMTLTRALQVRKRWLAIGENARRCYEKEFSPKSFATRVLDRINAAI
ncbi:glycosyltransferase family 4 protein [Sphingomonas aquatilis]